MEKSSEKTKGR